VPYVGFRKVRNLKGYEVYNMKARDGRNVATAPEALEENMTQAIEDEHARFPHKNLKNKAYTIVQSWHEKESKLYTPEEFNAMGRELAERFAPGHLAWVTTHTDKKHIHNHIVICSVHSETGKLLKHDEDDLDRMHAINNEIARSRGLSQIEPGINRIFKKLTKEAREEVKGEKQTWILDLAQKAEFARRLSTSYDEYVGYLSILGVNARVENKNISYQYGDKKRKRGKSLGFDYDKPGLEKAFKENDAKFAKRPELREQLVGRLHDKVRGGPGSPVGGPGAAPMDGASGSGGGEKDYGKFTKRDRRDSGDELPPIFDQHGGALHEEMKRANKRSIIDYCRENKIPLEKNKDGKWVLKGRDFIVIEVHEWTNTKTQKKGGLLEFVAIHDDTNYVRALAKIMGNPRLLILEEAVGSSKQSYRPFTVPKPTPEGRLGAKKALQRLLASRGHEDAGVEALLRSQRVHAGKDGSVWLMGEKEESAMEYTEELGGEWRAKRHGKPAGVFLEVLRPGRRLTVFRDPFTFAAASAKGTAEPDSSASLLVLFGDVPGKRLEEVLALHPHISEVHYAHSAKAEERDLGVSEVHAMNERFRSFGITFSEHSGSEGRSKRRGPDIGF
jgi:hypothetical protein